MKSEKIKKRHKKRSENALTHNRQIEKNGIRKRRLRVFAAMCTKTNEYR